MPRDLKTFGHPEYLESLPDYQKIRDCYDGERSVKEGGVNYLPRLKAQSQEDYDNYNFRALFFPIVGKTCQSMVGLATTRPPKVEYPTIMGKYFTDAGLDSQFTETYVGIFTEIVLMGRYGVLIDGPADLVGDPTLVPYLAENIVNWRYAAGKLTMLLLKEIVLEPGEDEFETKVRCQYRHCFLDSQGVYQVQVLDDDLKVLSFSIPVFSGSTIDFIPFVPFGSSGVHMDVDKPPMLDISTINISHYMTSADLEWGRHIVGLPTPVVTGVDVSTKLSIGGTAAWILPQSEAKASYLEFQGQGLGSLEHAMTDKIGLMSTMSARLVDNSTKGSEAADTVRLRYMNESASLVHIIGSVESGCMMMYNMLATLMKAGGQVSVKFSREVLGVGIQFKDLQTLFDAYFKGGVSKDTLLFNLRRLDAVDPNRTDDEELAAIRDPLPPMPAGNNQSGGLPH